MDQFMRLIKDILSFMIPLLVMVITFVIFVMLNRVVDNYETQINNDYMIMVVSKKKLDSKFFKEFETSKIIKVEVINKNKILKKVKNTLSNDSLKELKYKLPNFYKIYLESYPDTLMLETIKRDLLKNPKIIKVETFAKNHKQVYSMLLLLQKVLGIFTIIVIIISVLVLMKQITLWLLRHQETMKIMELFGSSLLFRTGELFKVATISLFLTYFIVVGLLYYFKSNIGLYFDTNIFSFLDFRVDFVFDSIKIFGVTFLLSFLPVASVIITHKNNIKLT
jgi:cell division transport system permease protein